MTDEQKNGRRVRPEIYDLRLTLSLHRLSHTHNRFTSPNQQVSLKRCVYQTRLATLHILHNNKKKARSWEEERAGDLSVWCAVSRCVYYLDGLVMVSSRFISLLSHVCASGWSSRSLSSHGSLASPIRAR